MVLGYARLLRSGGSSGVRGRKEGVRWLCTRVDWGSKDSHAGGDVGYVGREG